MSTIKNIRSGFKKYCNFGNIVIFIILVFITLSHTELIYNNSSRLCILLLLMSYLIFLLIIAEHLWHVEQKSKEEIILDEETLNKMEKNYKGINMENASVRLFFHLIEHPIFQIL